MFNGLVGCLEDGSRSVQRLDGCHRIIKARDVDSSHAGDGIKSEAESFIGNVTLDHLSCQDKLILVAKPTILEKEMSRTGNPT